MPKRNLIWMIAIVAAAAVAVLVMRPAAPRSDDPNGIRFRPVIHAYRTLTRQAYRRPDDANLLRGAVRGMAEELDEYSSYVPPERLASFRARLKGRVTCIGLLADWEGGDGEVLGALPGSPAHAAGIQPGGRMLTIAGQDVQAVAPELLRRLLLGPQPGPVRMRIVDPAGRERNYALTPDRFEIETVTGVRREGDGRWRFYADPDERLAYVRIREFVPRTAGELNRALRELAAARGIVLDLRDNPGGDLEAGCAAADLFLREGVIFTRVDRAGRSRSFSASPQGTHANVPLVVLVNGETASAAEIVAGSLRLHDRAVLVGGRTRGKGLVQSMITLPGRLGQVNLTTAEFFLGAAVRVTRTPGAEAWGVAPHVEMPLSAAERRATRRHATAVLAAPGPPRAPATAPTTAPAGPRVRPIDQIDPQVAHAVELLREPGRIEAILAQAAADRAAVDDPNTATADPNSRP